MLLLWFTVITFHEDWGSTFLLLQEQKEEENQDTEEEENHYFVFDCCLNKSFKKTSFHQDEELWGFIGNVEDVQNFIHRYECRDMKTACSMITLIYTSRCQQNTLLLLYMHCNVTYFTVDNFWDEECFTEESLRDDWMDNIHKK